jgi:hypothetical protein
MVEEVAVISTEEQHRVQAQAAEIAAELHAAKGAGAGCKNGARVRITHQFKGESGEYVMALAHELRDVHDCRWFSTCLARYHPEAYRSLDDDQVEAFGQGIDSKGAEDSFARILSGPAWLHGLISDDLIHRWASSEDRWARRAALVSTVALNVRSADGGTGDTPRTLAVCQMLVDDRDEMVTQALSWALRALVGHDAGAVRAFVAEYEDRLAAPVLREVKHRLEA